MRHLILLLAALRFSVVALAADDWQSLFNGKDLNCWRANVMPDSFTVVDGAQNVFQIESI